jgi:glycosyltransferase involved in cell wall biosynthesis
MFYHPAVPRPLLLAWIAQADVLLNTSESEGMSNAIMEAMALGTPVVARRHAGNLSLIKEGETGLAFSTPLEAMAACDRVLAGSNALLGTGGVANADGASSRQQGGNALPLSLRARLISGAAAFITDHHSADAERRAWTALMARMITSP